jgi:hypothetical protein
MAVGTTQAVLAKKGENGDSPYKLPFFLPDWRYSYGKMENLSTANVEIRGWDDDWGQVTNPRPPV